MAETATVLYSEAQSSCFSCCVYAKHSREKENSPLQNKQKPSSKQREGSWASAGRRRLPRCGAEPQGCLQLPQRHNDGQALVGSAWASASPTPKRCPCCSPLRKAHRQGMGTRGHTDKPHTRCSPGPCSDGRPVPRVPLRPGGGLGETWGKTRACPRLQAPCGPGVLSTRRRAGSPTLHPSRPNSWPGPGLDEHEATPGSSAGVPGEREMVRAAPLGDPHGPCCVLMSLGGRGRSGSGCSGGVSGGTWAFATPAPKPGSPPSTLMCRSLHTDAPKHWAL